MNNQRFTVKDYVVLGATGLVIAAIVGPLAALVMTPGLMPTLLAAAIAWTLLLGTPALIMYTIKWYYSK